MNTATHFRRAIGIALIATTFFAFVVTIEYLHVVVKERGQRQQYDAAQLLAMQSRAEIEAEIANIKALARSLTNYITANPNLALESLRPIAAAIIKQNAMIRNVGVAPNNIIAFVEPMAGNAQAIGFDYRSDARQWRQVTQSITTQQIVLVGPLELVQGGTALIARAPVFLDPPFNTDVWGMTSVVINYDRFLQQVKLDQLTRDGFKLSLIDGDSGEVFYGDTATLDNALLVQPLSIRGNNWSIAVAFEDEGGIGDFYEVRLIGYSALAVIVLVVVIAIRLFLQNYQHATRDMLTGLGNRRLLTERLEALVQRYRSNSKGFTILSIDLNKFKEVNDNFGHQAGDELLQGVAARLTKAAQGLRGSAIRTGGDEFIILVPNILTEDDIASTIDTLQQQIIDEPYPILGHSIRIGASIGAARYPQDSDNLDALLELADTNMYQQKRMRRS